eukprot:2206149-Rhodomonas_salina.1
MVVVPTAEHVHDASICGGHTTCTHCKDTYERALVLEKEINDEVKSLGLVINEKMMRPTHEGEFLGIGFDSLCGTFWLSESKAATLAAAAAELIEAAHASPRDLAKSRGRMTWYAHAAQA